MKEFEIKINLKVKLDPNQYDNEVVTKEYVKACIEEQYKVGEAQMVGFDLEFTPTEYEVEVIEGEGNKDNVIKFDTSHD